MNLYLLQRITRGWFLVGGRFLRQVLGVFSIRIFAKNMGDPYYEPTIVVHDEEHQEYLSSQPDSYLHIVT